MQVARGILPADLYHEDMTRLIGPSTRNGGFETLGGGGADVFGSWNESVSGTSTITDDTTTPHGGAHAAQLNVDASASYVAILMSSIMTVGKRYRLEMWAKTTDAAKGAQITIGSPQAVAITASWAKYTITDIASTVTLALARLAGQSSYSLFFDDVVFEPVGLMGSWNFSYGHGQFIPDRGPKHVPLTSSGLLTTIDERLCAPVDRSAESHGSSMTVDFNSYPVVLLPQATADYTLYFSNAKPGREMVIHGSCDGTGRAITLDPSFTWVDRGGAVATHTASKEWTLTVSFISATKALYQYTEQA
jgi:hypothetical protein